jgi:hypothetical protein
VGTVMFSPTPNGTPDRPMVYGMTQAEMAPCAAAPAPCAPQADALTGRAGGRAGVLGLAIERLERGGVDARYLTIRTQAQMLGCMPAALMLLPEQWPRPGGALDCSERLPDREGRASQ